MAAGKKTKYTAIALTVFVGAAVFVAAIVMFASWLVDDNSKQVVEKQPVSPDVENTASGAYPSLDEANNENIVVTDDSSIQKLDNGNVVNTQTLESAAAYTAGEDGLSNSSDSIDEDIDIVAFDNQSEGAIQWKAPTKIAYSRADITISGSDGKLIKKSYRPGEQMVLSEGLVDGLYSWESVVTPEVDSHVREEMRQVRSMGDLEAENELLERLRANGSLPSEAQASENRQSGTFTVKDGVARPNYVDEPTGSKQDGSVK